MKNKNHHRTDPLGRAGRFRPRPLGPRARGILTSVHQKSIAVFRLAEGMTNLGSGSLKVSSPAFVLRNKAHQFSLVAGLRLSGNGEGWGR